MARESDILQLQQIIELEGRMRELNEELMAARAKGETEVEKKRAREMTVMKKERAIGMTTLNKQEKGEEE
jgi:hypothetical protein